MTVMPSSPTARTGALGKGQIHEHTFGAGQPRRAGEAVLSGARGPMVPVTAGNWVQTRIGGLCTCGVHVV